MAQIESPSRFLLACVCLAGLSCLAAGTASAQTGPIVDKFELGDAIEPPVAGTGDILSLSGVAGPDWEELFNADGSLRDGVDATGTPPGNGIPDFKDLYQGLDALFVGDDVSAGLFTDLTVKFGTDNLGTGPVGAIDDMTNAYVYLTKDASDNLLLFAGIERIQTGPGDIELELNQGMFRVGRGWPQTSGWEIVGHWMPKDLRLRLSYGVDGLMTSLTVESWEDPEADGTYSWVEKQRLTSEGCNQANTICAFRNGASIPGGDWPSFDASGNPVASLDEKCFLEFGVNVSALLEITDSLYRYKTVRLRSPADLVIGHFGEGN